MDYRMAPCTVAECLVAQPPVGYVGRVRIDMTLKTQESPLGAQQKMALNGSVRLMAGSAPLHSQCRMFVYIRSALFGMAPDAGLIIHFS